PAGYRSRPHDCSAPGRAPWRTNLGGGRARRRCGLRGSLTAFGPPGRLMGQSGPAGFGSSHSAAIGHVSGPAPADDRLVLVVDDEADLLQIVSDRLTAAGYRVLTARAGI